MNWKTIAQKLMSRKEQQMLKPPKSKNGMYKILDNWMYLDDEDSLNLSKYGIYEIAETNFIKKSIKPSFTVIDIGAHIGYYTLMMARLAKHVYAFEPEQKNFELLQKNIAVNKVTNVTLYKKAVSEKTGKTMLYLCNINTGMNRIYPSKWCDKTVDVETARLDDIIDHADFIKIDIEGAELGALKGMTKLLKKGVTVLMEFHPPSIIEFGAKPIDVYNYLKSFGYHISLPDKEVTYEELEKTSIERVGTNIVCTKVK